MSRKQQGVTICTRVTTSAAILLHKIATEQFLKHHDAHREIGLKRPVNRLAVDYLIYMGLSTESKERHEYVEEANLFKQILDVESKKTYAKVKSASKKKVKVEYHG